MTAIGPADDELIDISVLVNATTPEWPGDIPFSCRWSWEVARGDSVNVSCVSGSPHVGTHADAPFHVDAGWPASDALDLAAFTGSATVADAGAGEGPLPFESLGIGSQPVERLLLRTGRTIAGGTFPAAWPWVDVSAVASLLDRGLRLLGVDAPSVDARDSRTLDVHRALFRGGASVLENLDLRRVAPGPYHLIALPLRLDGLDAAPVRAVLRRLTVT